MSNNTTEGSISDENEEKVKTDVLVLARFFRKILNV